ncbi:camp-regulated phospho protein/endosulfine conserved region-domain-containing protein [Naematelia encephala]|uniref:mRNA stability protein n=1 Tax=Naematelia encephala TaxID=71784 RepID=A0A1Y2AIW7_9TREE|nr:camp-regulated phospho protein/endosulfine conserved region-domain-containing protein [Naematelia encephala]
MNPHKLNKVDISSLSEQDQKAFKMYGKIPGKNLLTKMQKERKYFDSGDYMMSKAGAPNAEQPGTAIPTPQHLPHASPPSNAGTPINLASSPTGNMPISSPRALSPEKSQSLPGAGGVGVGISPAATSEAVEVPGMAMRHQQYRLIRPFSNQARISPPGTMRDAGTSSSYPIQHGAGTGFGSSPVKASSLANRLDEEMEG